MLGKFKAWPGFILPLLAHSAVHGAATYAIAMFVRPEIALYLATIDMSAHFLIDRIKASPSLLGRFKALSSNEYRYCAIQRDAFVKLVASTKIAEKDKLNYVAGISQIDKTFRSNVYFWWSLGADQFAHHSCHYFLIYVLVS